MAGFTDALRGDGLARAHRALAGLEEDPLQLDRARRRFSDSPPPYTSYISGITIRSASLDPRSDEQQRREERRWQLIREGDASLPRAQFAAQVEEERRRIWNADPRTNWVRICIGDETFREDAREIVKKRWIEQGIWNSKWNEVADGRWKHEEPLEPQSESDDDIKPKPTPRPFGLFGTPQKKSQPKLKWPKTNGEKRWIAEQREVRQREREASRPYYQFLYQISKEREEIQDESANGEVTYTADINTKAYENVKDTWTRRRIWNARWGILPGMLWKHEEPLDEEAADGSIPIPETPLGETQSSASHEAGDSPNIRIFGSASIQQDHPQETRAVKPWILRTIGKYGGIFDGSLRERLIANGDVPTDFFKTNVGGTKSSEYGLNLAGTGGESPKEGSSNDPPPVRANVLGELNHKVGKSLTGHISGSPSPVKLNYHHALNTLNLSEQEQPFAIGSGGFENDDAERSLSESRLPGPSSSKRGLCHIEGQVLLPDGRKQSHHDSQPASASFDSLHSSKVSKAPRKKRRGYERQSSNPQRVSFDGLPLSPRADVQPRPSQAPVNLRRSPRLQPQIRSIAEDPKRAIRSKSKQKFTKNMTARNSAKPQGISKRPSAKTTGGRGKARKD